MNRTFTPEQQRVAAEARAATRAGFKQQSIRINADWLITRSDEINWLITYKTDKYGYFSSITAALEALPRKMINETTYSSIAELSANVQAIHQTIRDAIGLNPKQAIGTIQDRRQ